MTMHFVAGFGVGAIVMLCLFGAASISLEFLREQERQQRHQELMRNRRVPHYRHD